MKGPLLYLPIFCMAASAGAQIPGELPERVEVSDLVRAAGRYTERRVTVVGELRSGDMTDMENDIYEVRDENSFDTVRVGQAWGSMSDLRFLNGQRVEITGIFWDLSQSVMPTTNGPVPIDPRLRNFPGAVRPDMERENKRYFIGVESVTALEMDSVDLSPEEPEEEIVDPDIELPPSSLIDLRNLLEAPNPYVGKQIAVIGKFRGNNLYGDLSIQDKKTPRDFVMKVADAAIWVTGKNPRGRDFSLNSDMRRDTGKWLKVIGVPWMDEDTVYLRAQKIELAEHPGDPDLEPSDPRQAMREEQKGAGPPPELAFSLPLDGERGVRLDSEFRVQFSKDMNRQSFDRNVDLLYADDPGTGDPFPDISISYEPGSRTLVVSPGRRLDPGREIRLILYEGIVDTESQPLVPSPSTEEYPGAAVVLSFFTAS